MGDEDFHGLPDCHLHLRELHGQPYFFAHADNDPNGSYPYQEYWAVPNSSVPVPLDQWFSVEFYLHRSTGGDGRFYWAVNGHTVVDHYGPNYGVNNEKVNALMFSNLYGNSVHLNPGYQWIDDLEVWDLPPCAALPCGAPTSGATPPTSIPARLEHTPSGPLAISQLPRMTDSASTSIASW